MLNLEDWVRHSSSQSGSIIAFYCYGEIRNADTTVFDGMARALCYAVFFTALNGANNADSGKSLWDYVLG